MRDQAPCPCGSGASYGECCGRFHSALAAGSSGEGASAEAFGGPVLAPTAEALMRSRYSAFVVGDVGYLLATWHPATRPEDLTLDPTLRWTGLDVVGATAGGPDDTRGSVSFVAHYERDGQAGEQRENSSFRRHEGRWVYVAEVFSPT